MERRIREPREKKCACGATVTLHNSWANTCQKCGTEFNGSGQTLAPRSHWGEETGETFLEGEPLGDDTL